jgi:hypothetical protein
VRRSDTPKHLCGCPSIVPFIAPPEGLLVFPSRSDVSMLPAQHSECMTMELVPTRKVPAGKSIGGAQVSDTFPPSQCCRNCWERDPGETYSVSSMSLGKENSLMPMQPSPMADTFRPLFPSSRFCILRSPCRASVVNIRAVVLLGFVSSLGNRARRWSEAPSRLSVCRSFHRTGGTAARFSGSGRQDTVGGFGGALRQPYTSAPCFSGHVALTPIKRPGTPQKQFARPTFA